MKYLIINCDCSNGSTGSICTKRAKELMSAGHKVYIAYGRGKIADEFKNISIKIGFNFCIALHVISNRIFDNHGLDWNSYFSTKKFITWIKKYDPDVIWLNNIHGYHLNIKLLFNYLSKSGKKIEWTFHDCWAFTGHCSHFTYVKCDKWRTICNNCPQKTEYPKSILIDNSKRNYKIKKKLFTSIKKENLKIITPSNWLKNLVKESFFKDYEVEVVHNTIDTNIFKPTKNNFREIYGLQDKIIILGVALPWTKRKGLNDFVKLSKILDNRFVIVLVGLSKEQVVNLNKSVSVIGNIDNVLELVKIHCTSDYKSKNDKYIVPTGDINAIAKILINNAMFKVDNDCAKFVLIKRTQNAKILAAIYSTADYFINTTYEENYPTVNLEAKACGCKIITYDTGGCRETLDE